MKHIMLDIETFSTRPQAVILAIGAVLFDEERVYTDHAFYSPLCIQPQLDEGRIVDEDTVLWWMDQSKKAQMATFNSPQHHASVLVSFNEFLEAQSTTEGDLLIWGNGSDFDNATLQELYYSCHLEPGWTYRQNRCYRTLRKCFPLEVESTEETRHMALADAKWQANHLVQICQKYNLTLK